MLEETAEHLSRVGRPGEVVFALMDDAAYQVFTRTLQRWAAAAGGEVE